jgi:hypothetical protein
VGWREPWRLATVRDRVWAAGLPAIAAGGPSSSSTATSGVASRPWGELAAGRSAASMTATVLLQSWAQGIEVWGQHGMGKLWGARDVQCRRSRAHTRGLHRPRCRAGRRGRGPPCSWRLARTGVTRRARPAFALARVRGRSPLWLRLSASGSQIGGKRVNAIVGRTVRAGSAMAATIVVAFGLRERRPTRVGRGAG